MRNTKVLILPMLVIIGLLMAGFAYASWTETLYIEGSVATGECDWEFTVVSPPIDPKDPPTKDYHCYDGFEGWTYWPGDKNVGWTTAVLEPDKKTVTVTLHNVYPSYFVSMSVYAHNTGSIPIIFEKVVIDGFEITDPDDPSVVGLDLNGDDLDDIEIWWGDSIGLQREPCEVFAEMSFWIHILQNAPQGATLSFTIELVAIQYNESSHYTP